MDISTVIGLILAVGLVLGAIMTTTSITTFIDIPSILVVIGGTIAATLIAFPLNRVFKLVSVFMKTIFNKPANSLENMSAIVSLAEIARRDGILSLESHLADGKFDDFLTRGLRMAIDGQEPGVIESAMELELESLIERHANGKAILDTVGKYAPAFGMIGTLIGLVVMLQNMEDASQLGPAMAVALITTFYGSCVANMVALPLADKLALRSAEEVSSKVMIIRGVMCIQAGDNPRIVKQKLLAFLDPKQRVAAEELET